MTIRRPFRRDLREWLDREAAGLPHPSIKSEFIVYVIRHVPSGKEYVGYTGRGLKVRWAAHLAAAKSKPHPLYDAMREFGVDQFTIEPLHVFAENVGRRVEWEETVQRKAFAPHGFNKRPPRDHRRFIGDGRHA